MRIFGFTAILVVTAMFAYEGAYWLNGLKVVRHYQVQDVMQYLDR